MNERLKGKKKSTSIISVLQKATNLEGFVPCINDVVTRQTVIKRDCSRL